MKILRADNSRRELFKSKDQSSPKPLRKKSNAAEFKRILEQAMNEKEDWEEFNILLPKHGQYWDNGYEDLK